MKPKFYYLQELKELLFDLRLKLSKQRKSEPWSLDSLHSVLSKLKNNKSRDPHGMVNEIFKPGVIGTDLKISLLKLLNEIKDKSHIPEFMQWANITSLYKGKGEKVDLNNERGIFIVSILRSILMRLVYKEKYEIIDSNMSDSNVGARKVKGLGTTFISLMVSLMMSFPPNLRQILTYKSWTINNVLIQCG